MKSIRLLPVVMAFCTFFTLGCQQGKKKDSVETNVYVEGVKKCEEISQQLVPLGVEVNGISPVVDKNQAALNIKEIVPQELSSIQFLLEEYINTANKILKAGDTKVVLFPEKEKIQNNLQRASKFLGQIYATRVWDLQISAVVTREVDWTEYEIRYKRFHNYLNKIKQYGFDLESPDLSFAPISKLKNTDLNYLREEAIKVRYDLLRNKDLSDRNQHFGMKGFETIAKTAEPLAGFFMRLEQKALLELQAREKKSPK